MIEFYSDPEGGLKGLYDSIMRFPTDANHAFDPVDWDEVIARLYKLARQHVNFDNSVRGRLYWDGEHLVLYIWSSLS